MTRVKYALAWMGGVALAWFPGCGQCEELPPFPHGRYVVEAAGLPPWEVGMAVELGRDGGYDFVRVTFTDADGAEWEILYQ